jgi:hypothetical protein
VSPVERDASIDDLLDRAVVAINRGDRVSATALAGQVLAVDCGNADAEDLLASRSGGCAQRERGAGGGGRRRHRPPCGSRPAVLVARAALIDVVSRMPTNNAWPDLARAEASLPEDSPRIGDRSCRNAQRRVPR